MARPLSPILNPGFESAPGAEKSSLLQNPQLNSGQQQMFQRIWRIFAMIRNQPGQESRRFPRWRVAIAICALTAGVTFVINLALAIWAASFGFKGGLAMVQKDKCSKIKGLDLGLHLGINVLSTLLLGASNYTMQCLASPTREEINRAHWKRNVLDIGIPSLRNLTKVSRTRIFLWSLLAISSIPLHLLYNSVVFSSIITRSYYVFVVSEDFLTGAPFGTIPAKFGAVPGEAQYHLENLRDHQSSLQRLDINACLNLYRTSYLTDRADVLAISSALSLVTNTSLLYGTMSDSRTKGIVGYSWTCTDHEYPRFEKDCPLQPDNFKIHRFPIDYCLSQPIDESCQLQFSLVIIIIILACNLIKAVCMAYIAWKPSPAPLLTFGDAVASFLDEPDQTTTKNCLADKFRFRKTDSSAGNDLPDGLAGWRKSIVTWTPKRYSWFNAASWSRWFFCLFWCSVTLIACGILLRSAFMGPLVEQDKSLSALSRLGFGTVTSTTLMGFSAPAGPMILLANSPQALLSFLYLTYNGLFTCMLLADEWSGFAHERKTLRVSSPVGNQRSSYWLHLPYRYGIPLMAMSSVLHWVISQSIFYVRIISMGSDGGDSWLLSTCGFSPIAIITSMFLGAFLLLVLLLNGCRRYKAGMPLVGSASAAISAACHRPKEDVDAALLPVLWGAVSTDYSEDGVGHCCFTSFEVSPPIEGNLYAGRHDAVDSTTKSCTSSGIEPSPLM